MLSTCSCGCSPLPCSVYQRGTSTCLYDNKCVQLFEAWAVFEQAHKQFKAAASVYRQGLRAGMPYVDQLWTAYCQFAAINDFDVLACEDGDAEVRLVLGPRQLRCTVSFAAA